MRELSAGKFVLLVISDRRMESSRNRRSLIAEGFECESINISLIMRRGGWRVVWPSWVDCALVLVTLKELNWSDETA